MHQAVHEVPLPLERLGSGSWGTRGILQRITGHFSGLLEISWPFLHPYCFLGREELYLQPWE